MDNSGLIVGELTREVSEVVLALDIDDEMIESTKEGTLSLYITHSFLENLPNLILQNTLLILLKK